jgi:hypothetical protein
MALIRAIRAQFKNQYEREFEDVVAELQARLGQHYDGLCDIVIGYLRNSLIDTKKKKKKKKKFGGE